MRVPGAAFLLALLASTACVRARGIRGRPDATRPPATRQAPLGGSILASTPSHLPAGSNFLTGATAYGFLSVVGFSDTNLFNPVGLPPGASVPPGSGNEVSPNNVAIKDSWTEFVSADDPTGIVDAFDITTGGRIKVSHVGGAAATGIADYIATLSSTAFAGCRLEPVSSNTSSFSLVASIAPATGVVTVTLPTAWDNPNFPTSGFSFTAAWQLRCPQNACYDNDGTPADSKLCGWLDPRHHGRWITPFAADDSTLKHRTVEDEAEVQALLASTDGSSKRCVGRCHAGRCTVSPKAKHCCMAPRADTYDEFLAALQGGGNTHKRTDDTWHCWE